MPKTFYIIDGHSQIYRCFHARMDNLTAPNGEPTKATHLFMRMLIKLVKEKKPDYLAVAMEGTRDSCIRRQLDPQYKANRPEKPPEVWVQVKRIKELIWMLGLPVCAFAAYEADDVIASLTRCAREVGNIKTTILTGDKDLMQLLDPTDMVDIYDMIAESRVTYEGAKAKWGIEDLKGLRTLFALMGDTSDNIPGVASIGKVTAIKLMQQFRTYKSLIEGLDNGVDCGIPEAKRKAILKAFDDGTLERYRTLIKLHDDLYTRRGSYPSSIMDCVKFTGLRMDAARPIFQTLGFKRWS